MKILIKKHIADYLTTKYGPNKKCVSIGMSQGGIIASKYVAGL